MPSGDHAALREDRAGVVDHDVESGLPGRRCSSTASPTERMDDMSATTATTRSAPCARGDLGADGLEPKRVAPDEDNAAHRARRARSAIVAAEPGGRTGHEHGPSDAATPADGSDQSNRRRRTALPMREKLPTIDHSSRPSTNWLIISRRAGNRGRDRRRGAGGRTRTLIPPRLAAPQPRSFGRRAGAGSPRTARPPTRAGQAAGRCSGGLVAERAGRVGRRQRRHVAADAVPSTATTTRRALSPTAGLAAEPIAKTL